MALKSAIAAACFLTIASLFPTAWAKVETWRQEGPTAFAKARREGVVISDERPRSARAFGLDTGKAERRAGLGPGQGPLRHHLCRHRRPGEGLSPRAQARRKLDLAYDSSDSQALALVVCPDGTVYVGTGPTGQVVNITDPAHPSSRPEP